MLMYFSLHQKLEVWLEAEREEQVQTEKKQVSKNRCENTCIDRDKRRTKRVCYQSERIKGDVLAALISG